VGCSQFRKREVFVEAGNEEIFAQFFDGRELDGDDAEGTGGVDVVLLVVDEERFLGQRAEAVQS
jgi:hypothetical protein